MKKRMVLLIGCVSILGILLSGCSSSSTKSANMSQDEVHKEDIEKADETKLTALSDSVKLLYSDDTYADLAENFNQDALDQARQTLKEAKTEKNLTKQQMHMIDEAEQHINSAEDMFIVVNTIDSFYTDDVIKEKTDTTESAIADTKSKLETLRDKTVFYEEYNAKILDVESQINHMEDVKASVFQIWDVENGVMAPEVTRQQYNDVLSAVETISNERLKMDLMAMVNAVDHTLTELEELARVAEAYEPSGNLSQSGGGSSSYSGGTSSEPASSSANDNSSSSGGTSSSDNSPSSQDSSSGSASSGDVSADGEYQGETEGGSSYGGDLSEDWFN